MNECRKYGGTSAMLMWVWVLLLTLFRPAIAAAVEETFATLQEMTFPIW